MEQSNYQERLMSIGPEMADALNHVVLNDLALTEEVARLARLFAGNSQEQQVVWADRVYEPQSFVIGCV